MATTPIYNPNLDFDLGLSYHSFIYYSSAVGWLLISFYAWINTRRHLEVARQLPIFTVIKWYFGMSFIEKLVTGTSVLVLELQLGPAPNLAFFMSNLLFLWNITFKYIIFMMICNGWCISKLTISQMSKQVVILMGASMMLLEVLLVGATSYYVYILIFAYVVAFKVFFAECYKAIKATTLQIAQLRVRRIE